MKRKRKAPRLELPDKRLKQEATAVGPLNHPVLSYYYANVVSLRQYILSKLPHNAKGRRRAIAQIGLQSGSSSGEIGLAEILDTFIVGASDTPSAAESQHRSDDFVTFTQQCSESTRSGQASGETTTQQSEVCVSEHEVTSSNIQTHKPIDR